MKAIRGPLFCGFCLHSFEEESSVIRTFEDLSGKLIKAQGHYTDTDRSAFFHIDHMEDCEGTFSVYDKDFCLYCERYTHRGYLAQVFRLPVEELPLMVLDQDLPVEINEFIKYRISEGIETFKGLPALLEPILHKAIKEIKLPLFV